MGELTTKKQNLPKKEAIGQYVHDMVDLEIRAHSLRQTVQETRTKAKIEEKQAQFLIARAKTEKERVSKLLQRMDAEKKPTFGSYYAKHDIALGIFGGICLIAAILLAVAVLSVPEVAPGAIIWGCIAITIIIISIFSSKKRYKKELNAKDREYLMANSNYKKSEQELAEAQKKMEHTQIYIQKLLAHADQLDKDIAEIEKMLQRNYALNIVPPDYRRLECLVWIDYAFRNDQVDTMRQATVQCDKWIRHTDTMEALNELAENITSVSALLASMNSNISMMNQDLFRIAEAQEKQLSETQSARYAAESVAQSVDRLEFYEEMKRHGTF